MTSREGLLGRQGSDPGRGGPAWVSAQWISWRINLPSILLLLVFGFAAGATGFVDPNDLLGDLLLPFVSLSVALILYEGGLTLRLEELGAVGGVVRNLVTFGALLTRRRGRCRRWSI